MVRLRVSSIIGRRLCDAPSGWNSSVGGFAMLWDRDVKVTVEEWEL